MKLILLNATIVDSTSSFHLKKCDLWIQNGAIESIQLSSKKAFQHESTKTWDIKGAFVSVGWADMRASLREPGFEFKEDLASAAKAAAAGGFTIITCLPNTEPAIAHKSAVEFVYQRAQTLPVHILPYAVVSQHRKGKELAELYDLHQAGAVGFTDANQPIADAGLMLRALQYSTIFGGKLLVHANEQSLSEGGRMHEGETSTYLGLKGIPALAEELMIVRDIELAKYANAPIHVSHLSSKGSVELIRKAKKQGVKVTCDVAVAHLCYTDTDLETFDTNFKLNPPLRSKADQKALWDGLIDGTIDCIVTDHAPEDIEHKQVEFEYAAPGIIGLQTAYSQLLAAAPKNFTEVHLAQALGNNPRAFLNKSISITKGAPAELTVFSPSGKWEYNEASNLSKSKNSPVLNQTLAGRVLGIINKDQLLKFYS